MVVCLTLAACGGGGGGQSGDASSLNAGAGTGNPGGPVADFKLTCQEARFVTLLNFYRLSLGKEVVAVSKAGTIAARWHAQDMISKNYFDHTEPSGRSPFARMNSFGYPGNAENIAWGASTAEKVFCMWKNSPGHNTNMLSNSRTVGIGLVGTYWSNGFGPVTSDTLSNPLTAEAGCTMPIALPVCS